MCNASTATATRTSSVLRFRETQTNTEPRIILELTDSGTNTVIMFRRKDAYTNTGPRIVLKQKHTSCNTDFCENIERRPRGRVLYLNDEPGVSEISIYASTLSLVPEDRREVARNRCRDAEEKRKEVARNRCYVENCRCAEEKRKEPENVPCRCPKTNVVHENYYVQAPANKTKCIPYLYKTDRATSSYTCLDEEEPMAFRGRMDGKRYKPTKIPMPVRYLPTGRTENARMRHHLRDSCCSLERDAHCYYCPGFVSFRPNKIKVLPSPLNNLDTLYRHPVYPKHYDYDYNRKYNAMPETSRVHQGKDGQTRSDSSDGIERNVGYFSCCRGFISHRPRKFKVLPSARDNLDTLYRHPMYLGKRYFGNEDKYDPQYETFKQGIKPESVNIVDPKDTTVQRFETLGRGNKSQYGKQSKKTFHTKNVIPYTENEDLNKTILPSSSQNYFLEDDSVESTDKPLTRQIGSSTIPTVESFNSSSPLKSKPILKTRTSSISKTIDWDDKLVSSNKPKTPRKSSADEEEFVKFYANVTQASSKDSVLNVQGSPPEDINKTHAGSFYEDQNVNLNYTLRGGEINFRTVQESIENETFPEEYKQIEETSPGENKNTEVLLMNQQIVELIEEVFDKEKQIANMQDLLSFTVKTLMTVLASLNAVEKKTTRINVQDMRHKIRGLEEENDQLRLAVKKITEELEELDKLSKSYVTDKETLESRCLSYEEKISLLETVKIPSLEQEVKDLQDKLAQSYVLDKEKQNTYCKDYEDKISLIKSEHDKERQSLQECCRQFEEKISSLDAEKLKILQEHQCCAEEYTAKEKKISEQFSQLEEKQKLGGETILNLEVELSKINADNLQHCCMIETLEVKIQELTAACCKPPMQTIAIETEQSKKANKCLNTAKCKHINQSTQSHAVNFDERLDYYDIQVVKAVPATFSSPSSTSASEIKSKKVDLVNFSDLKENIGKFMERDYEVDEAKKRITELEQELQQAWREKEKEVECARCCREQEIINLKEVINSLMKSLDNERKRSENLQRAISDQRVTISNLQDALVAVKHSLEEHRQKANQDYVNMLQVIEKLRDENLILEVDLFYYFQDIEMYEMRVLKYQQLLRDLQGQCYKVHGQVQSLENQKVQQSAFVDDLSEQLSECQDELRHLFNVLTEEQNLVENESITLTNHIMTLQAEMCALSQKLAVTLQCLESERKNNNVLEYQLNIRERESSCLTNELYMMKEKLREAANEIIAHQSKIIMLQSKLQEYEKSISLLDEESEMCQNNIQYCFKNLKDAQMSLEKRNKDYELMKINCTKEAGIANNLRIELQQARARYNEEMDRSRHAIKHLKEDLEKTNVAHVKEIADYIESVHGLQEKLREGEIRYKNTEEELSFAHTKLVEASESELKLRSDHVEMMTELNAKINSYMNEQERLISVISNLEHRISSMNKEIDRKDDQIALMKGNLAAIQTTNADQKREYQDDVCNLKNEINTLVQSQGILKSENDKLQAQVTKYHTMVSKNEEKGKLMMQELKQCLTELQTIQGDKEFLMQKNEQLAHEIQSLQDACQTKTESVVTLEMELNDTKCIRDTLCNESRNVINNVKAWLQEQRKINVELNNKIKQKNVLISQMNQENIILRNKIKQLSSGGGTLSQGSGYPKSRTPPSTLICRPHTPPISGPSWTSYGSTESASGSSDSELDGTDMAPFGTPQVWIHRVESLTEKLQRKNLFWKSKMDEHDFVVSKDK